MTTTAFRARILAILLVSACGSNEPTLTTNEITASDAFTFAPSHITVAAGTTVRWTNAGSLMHTVTSGANAPDLAGAEFDASLPPGQTFEHTFNAVGDHPFFCRPHAGMGMKGIVTVVPAEGSE